MKLKNEIDWHYKIFIISFKTLSLHVKKISNSILIIIYLHSNYFHQSFQIYSLDSQLSIQSAISIFLIQKFVHCLRSNRSTNRSTNTSRLSSLYHSSICRKFNRFVINHFAIIKNNIKMIFLFEITRLKDSFEYQTWQIEMRNQLIFMNFWHYVEIDEFSSSAILIVEISIEEIFNVFVVSSISKKVKKFRIDNLKTITIIWNRWKCNDQNLLKNEIYVIKTWQIFKKSFSSCESKILNDLLIKLWIIILIISQNVFDYAWRFQKTLQDILW